MTLAEARMLVPDVEVAPAKPADDVAALERLAIWCLRRYSPIAATDPPDGIWLDIAGMDHLFDGEADLIGDLLARLTEHGIVGKAAVADTAGVAYAVARYRRDLQVVPPGQQAAAIEPLYITALRLEHDIVDGLSRLGIETVGELERLPRGPLALRFGSNVGRRLDQAHGRLAEPIRPIVVPETLSTRLAFAEPIATPESLQRAIDVLVQRLCHDLEAKGLGARTLDLLFQRVDSDIQAVRIGTARPARDPKRLARLLADKLDKVDPGFGVEVMVLSAPLAEPMTSGQLGTIDEADAADVVGLVDTLANRLGPRRIFRLAAVESEVPERSVKVVPALSPPGRGSWPDAWPRPGRLLSPPEEIEVIAELPDQPPVLFVWRGTRRRVRRADGPERIHGEWWRRDAEMMAVRDYFQVETDGGERFWLYRSGDSQIVETGSLRWFLHGLFA